MGKLRCPALWLSVVCLGTLVITSYGGVLFGGRQFGFRDAAHFYYPLYWRVQQEWSSGRLPLWDPGQNGGTPMLGSPMAAVLYPGKVLFAVLPYAWAFRLYTVGHEILAFVAMAALVRSWGVSATGATLAGLSYAFGGVVLSDYFNVIYLVGAAWFPLGFRAADRWLRLGLRSGLAELAVVLAMQVLGGDPEAAYLTVLCAVGYAVGLARSRGRSASRPWLWGLGLFAMAAGWLWVGPRIVPQLHPPHGAWGQAIVATGWLVGLIVYLAIRHGGERARLATMLAGLASSCLLALSVSAVQVLPVLESMAVSVRWEGAGLEDRYDSSVLPYRVAEWVWPNVFGTFTAGNHYGMPLLPPIGGARPSPLSLYFGALPLVLAVVVLGFRDGPPWRGWMTAVAVLSFWAALGEFAGLARWLTRQPSPATGDDSFYGLLAAILPGFRLFRLPFKLLVLTSLALSALAGFGWDRIAAGVARRRAFAIGAGLLIGTAIGLAAVTAFQGRLIAAIQERAVTHGVYGPLDATGTVGEMRRGLMHGAIALSASLIVLAAAPRWSGPAALALVTVDLAIANAPLVITIPQADFEREPAIVRAIRDAERADPSPGPFRVHRLPSWVPIGWGRTASTERLRELVDWEIDTLQPGFGLLHGIRYVHDDQSQTGRADLKTLFRPEYQTADPELAAVLGVEPGRRILVFPRGAFDLWGARYFIIPAYPGDWTRDNRSYAAFLDNTDLVFPDTSAMASPDRIADRQHWMLDRDVQVRRNRAAFPRAWIVHGAWLLNKGRLFRSRNVSEPISRETILARLRSASDDLRTIAFVETDDPAGLSRHLAADNGRSGSFETVTVREESATRVVLNARLDRPGIIVLADVFDPGWRLTVDGIPAPVLRANLMMRGAAVAAGAHTLVYAYQPASFRLGAHVSLAGLAALSALAAWAFRQ